MIFRRKKTNARSRQVGEVQYKKQQSYHYSAKRSNTERLQGRREQQDEEAAQQRRKPTGRLALLPSFIALGLILVGIAYFLYIPPSVAVDTQGDTQFIGDQAAVQAKADEYMRSTLLNRTKLTFNEQKLQDSLVREFPEFTNITVSSPLLRHKPVVMVSFATPTLLLTNGTNNYIVSEAGVVLADITHHKPAIDTTKLLLVQDQTGVAIETGKVALTSEQVDYILEIAYQTDKKKLKIESLILVPGGGELHVRYGGLPYYVKYNMYEDPRKSSGTFLAVKEELNAKGVTPSAYIDVRIPERAYIK